MKPPLLGHTLPSWKLPWAVTLVSLLLSGLLLLAADTKNATNSNRQYLRSLQQAECTIDCCRQYETTFCPPTNEWVNALPVAVQYILIVFLVFMSAVFSGLTLGLMGLDKTGLEIVMEGDNAKNAAAAKRIYPVRKKGNLLLCTLLLGNVAVNSLLSILLADKAGGTVGFLISTMVIVIFGEIIPQALCSRYALEIGSRMVPLVKVIMILFLPVSYPLAFCLDKALGEELATIYSSAEMRKLLQIHVAEGQIDQETAEAMQGALNYKDVMVKNVMTPIEKTFMLNVDEHLNFECIAKIFKSGYSRIPVYEVSVNNIIGLLFVKDLIFIDPEDETSVRNFVQIFGRGAHVVWPDDKLGDVLRELKQGRSHMALVRDVNREDETQDPFYEIKGIITLEDIIEEILGDAIIDETDAFVDATQTVKVNRMDGFDWGRLRLLDSKIVDATLSLEETKAVTAHLRTNYADAVSLLSDRQLYLLVSETRVSELPTAVQEVGSDVPDDLLYEQGVATDICTLILSGKVTVLAGADKFRSDVSSWAVLGSSALTDPSYTPDFTAFVSSGPCRCLRFTRVRYIAAVDASALERRALSHESTRDDASEVAASAHHSTEHFESTHSLSIEEGADVPAKKRSTQMRRNKLIAAFQKSLKKGSNEHLDETEEETKPDAAKEESKSVTFLSPTAGGSTLSGDDVRSTRTAKSANLDETTMKADDQAPSTSQRRSSFQYIGSRQKDTLDEDETAS